jgi:hypothetical protein
MDGQREKVRSEEYIYLVDPFVEINKFVAMRHRGPSVFAVLSGRRLCRWISRRLRLRRIRCGFSK